MNKKLFVVLVVVTAILVTGALMAAERAAIKGVPEKFQVQKLGHKQSATAVPQHELTSQLSALPFATSSQPADRSVWNLFSPATPGAILWYCDAQTAPVDNQILGVETLRDTIYTTGGNTGVDPNKVYAWLRTGGSCVYLYGVNQPAASTGWGWRDLAADDQYLYASYSTVLNCFYMTPGGVVEVPANNITFAALNPIRAVAYDPIHDWFWGANFSSNIYAFNRAGVQMASYANTHPLYGLAFDTLSQGSARPWLWCYSQDSSKVYQFDPSTGTYTGVVYSARGEGGNGVGIAGGLCLYEGNASKPTATLLGLVQGVPVDEIWAMDITPVEPWGCCQLPGSCAMMTQTACQTAGGTFHPSPDTCISNVCQTPVDTTCHLQWDNGGAAYYFGSWNVGDQQAVYYNPATMCTGCGPNVYPFRLTQVSGLFYDFAGAGSVDVIFHVYEAGPDTCTGPLAEIYSFPATITTFYPNEAVVPLPEVLCLEDDFFLAVEYNSGTTGSIPCLLMDTQSPLYCVQFNWYDGYSPPWIEWWDFWTPPPPGYIILRADGYCNSQACPIECDLIQDGGHVALYFSGLSAGDQIAKYFDPELYCVPPVYPYNVHDVDIFLYDFAGAGTVNLRIGVNTVCHDSCDGPGTQIYRSDPITVTDFYPNMARIVLPDPVCVYEPFFIVVEWTSGVAGSTPSFLMEGPAYPCDTCHAWMWYDGYSPPWWEWSDFWSPPVPGCPIVRVSGYTHHPDCQMAPCDTTTETIWGGLSPTYVWRNPSRYGDRWLAERFDLPGSHGGRLDQIEMAFYATGSTGTPDPDIRVWLPDPSGVYPSDNNPPYQSIGDFHLDYTQILWYPSYTVVQTWQRGLIFDPGESFFVGYGHAYTPGDTLRCLSDNGALNSNRSVEYALPGQWGTMLDDWGYGIDYMFNAVICPYTPPESTFTIACAPPNANAVPGDPPMNLFTVDVGSVLGYHLNVDLSCTPPAGINVSFNPDNVPAPYLSDVSVSVAPGTPYGDYTLTFCGTGADGQGPKCCNVTLTVQPPFDEADVAFFHGSQKASNFGAVANDAANNNFLWYGLTAQLFDGSLMQARIDGDHIAMDVYNCVHWGYVPSEHLKLYYDPKYNANIAQGHFFTPDTFIGVEDTFWTVGIMEPGVDFSIKIIRKWWDCSGGPWPWYSAIYEDWDVGDAYNNWGDMDTLHNLIYQYDPVDPTLVFGMMEAPFYDALLHNMVFVRNPVYVWPGQGFCGTQPQLLDSLFLLISRPGYVYPQPPDTDFSILISELIPPEWWHTWKINIVIDFGRNLNDGLSWSQWWHRVLRYVGFYRGDVNASDTLELPSLDVSDLVYLISYQFENGPAPIPYADQGDVNADGIVNIADIIYLLNYVFKNGPAPIDYVRFIPSMYSRESLFENPNWR